MAVVTEKPGRRMSPLGYKILAILEDGKDHDWEEVIDKVQYTIAPGEAYRTGVERSKAKDPNSRPMDDLIATGRRHQTVVAINNLISNGRVERIGERRDEKKILRLKKQVHQIFVVRDRVGVLKTFHITSPDVVVHVVDEQGTSTDPEEDAKAIRDIYDSIPMRLDGRQEIRAACERLMSRLNVDAKLQQAGVTRFPPSIDYNNPNAVTGGTEQGDIAQ